MGATLFAGVWLGMKSSVEGVVILFLTLGAHGETAHACALAVVGDGACNAVAWATVGAVGKGVEIAPVCFIKNIVQALVACRHIRADEDVMPCMGGALVDGEVCFSFNKGQGRLLVVCNRGQWW